jgi:hypothetical protein
MGMAKLVYEGFEQGFGPEYPAAITILGIRRPLEFETRFIRPFREPHLPHPHEFRISRFVDGSASITLSQLERQWATWTEADRLDFCVSIDDLQLLEQPDLPAMVGFIARHGNPDELSAVAPAFCRLFTPAESFELAVLALQRSQVGRTSNIMQAIALTNDLRAQAVLREQLQTIWTEPSLWMDADFVNGVAFDAVNCIWYLMKLSAPPVEFEDAVRRLSAHSCRRVREQCQRLFTKCFPWLAPVATP